MPVNKRSRKGKQGGGKQQSFPVMAAVAPSATAADVSAPLEPTPTASSTAQTQTSNNNNNNNNNSNNNNNNKSSGLVLTSDQRRGVFECDYCRNDISQHPRIRCAVCDDFDLCCDCFVTATTRAAAASSQQQQQQQQQHHPQHDPRTHGYRVCDSTRYPLFPVRAAVKTASKRKINSNNSNNNNNNNINNNNTASPVPMDIEGDDTATPAAPSVGSAPAAALILSTSDDPKQVWWTVEEDLRLLRGIEIHGLGNWADVAEAVAGPGSAGKTPRRCLERYWDDFLGRYGHVVPPYTLVPVDQDPDLTAAAAAATCVGCETTVLQPAEGMEEQNNSVAAVSEEGRGGGDESDNLVTSNAPASTVKETTAPQASSSSNAEPVTTAEESNTATTIAAVPTTAGGESVRASKRRAAMLRSPSNMSRVSEAMSSSSNVNVTAAAAAIKKYKAVPTESLPEYRQFFPDPYLPQWENNSSSSNNHTAPVQLGQEVGRDKAVRAESTYVRAIASLETPEQVEKVRQDWERNRLNQPGGPTVLPLRVDDIPNLPGSELVGFMPRRGDFDVEWENNAEENIADMEFIPGESEQDRQLKLQVLAIYNSKLDEREKRKDFVLRRKLYDYRQHQLEYQKLPRDERDLLHRMRLFERFHTPAEHQQFIADLLKAKRLRKEIAKLQMYRRMGIRTLLEAERYELDKARRHFHKHAHIQKDLEAKKAEAAAAAAGDAHPATHESSTSSYYWKQYRTGERKVRKSINRGDGGTVMATTVFDDINNNNNNNNKPKDPPSAAALEGDEAKSDKDLITVDTTTTPSGSDAMDVDTPKGGSDEMDKPSLNKNDNKGEDDDTKPPATTTASPPITATTTTTIARDISQMPGFALLSPREVELCRSVSLQPSQYLEIKKALIAESLRQGLLDDRQKQQRNSSSGGGGSSSKSNKKGHFQRSLVKIDVERHGAVVDFVVRAGWIPTAFGQSARGREG